MRKEKHIPTQAEVLEVLTELATRPELSNFKIGLFGSYARNNCNSRSDIDIIFRELNEPENPLSALSTTAFIRKFIREKLHKSVDLLDYYDVPLPGTAFRKRDGRKLDIILLDIPWGYQGNKTFQEVIS